MRSEQYYMHVDTNVMVMATTTFSDEHAVWIDVKALLMTSCSSIFTLHQTY